MIEIHSVAVHAVLMASSFAVGWLAAPTINYHRGIRDGAETVQEGR